MPIRYGTFVSSEDGFDVFLTMVDYSGSGVRELMYVEFVVRREGRIDLFLSLTIDKFLLLYDLFCSFFDIFLDEGGDDDENGEDGSGGEGGGGDNVLLDVLRMKRSARFKKSSLN